MCKFLLFVALATGGHGFISPPETKCDANQMTSICSPFAGGSVHIKLWVNGTGHKLQCSKDRVDIFTLKGEKVKIDDAYKNRIEFSYKTETLIIFKVEKNDKGQYTVRRFNNEGKQDKLFSFTLQVKENVYCILVTVGIVAVCVLLIVVVVTSVCCRLKKSKKSKRRQEKEINT